MMSTSISGLIALAAITSALVSPEQPPSKQPAFPQTQQPHPTGKDPYKNLFWETESQAGVPAVPVSPLPQVIGAVLFVESHASKVESKCHVRMLQIDPGFDAGMRVLIPDEKVANSKIRVIAPPCSR